MRIDRNKALVLLSGAALGIFVGLFKPSFHDPNNNLSSLVATIFSVMAGFIAVALNLVVATRPEIFKNVISQRRYSKTMERRIRRHNWLFYVYLGVLLCVFLSELCGKKWPEISGALETIYLGLSASALVWSFMIPGTIMQLHNEGNIIARRLSKT